MLDRRVTKAMTSPQRIVLLLASVILVGALAMLLTGGGSRDARAGTGPIVNTTDDAAPDGSCNLAHCSLREALLYAADNDTISFDINSGCVSGICTIKPQSALPALGKLNVTLDGYTQIGASPNTTGAFEPTNADIRIVIDGSDITTGSAYGLWVAAAGTTIRGLSIVNFEEEGIKTGTFPSVIIRGNYIGILPDGETAAGNGKGIHIMSSQSGNAIGGNSPADRNVISGNLGDGAWLTGGFGVVAANNFVGTNAAGTSAVPNGGHGIHLQGAPTSTIGISSEGAGNLLSGNTMSGVAMTTPDAHDIRVKGNRIGTAADGVSPLPNQDHGVFLDQGAEDNTIGGEFDVDEENIIAFNAKAGVALSPSAGIDNYIDPSSTHSNGGLGADLLADGQVLANDADDSDVGANDLMNYPVVNSAQWDGATLTVNASLTSEPSAFYNMFIFVNRECDPSGYGEGERFLVSQGASIDASGTKAFTRNISVSDIADMKFVTMAASNPESTSEFSACEEIEYTGPETPTASPTPATTPTPTPDASVTPTSTPGPSDTASPSDSATPAATATPTSAGLEVAWANLDCSGDINPVDALKALRADAGLSVNQPANCPPIGEEVEAGGETRTWGDVDCNLAFSPVDGLKILRFDAALPVAQESGCPAMNEIVTVV